MCKGCLVASWRWILILFLYSKSIRGLDFVYKISWSQPLRNHAPFVVLELDSNKKNLSGVVKFRNLNSGNLWDMSPIKKKSQTGLCSVTWLAHHPCKMKEEFKSHTIHLFVQRLSKDRNFIMPSSHSGRLHLTCNQVP